MVKSWGLVLVFWMAMWLLQAQETVQLAGVEVVGISEESVADPVNANWENTTFQPRLIRYFVLLPWMTKNRRTLIFARPQWQSQQFDIRQGPELFHLPDDLFSFSLQMGVLQRLGQRGQLAAAVRPTLAGEPELDADERQDAWVWQASLLYAHRISQDSSLTLGLGIANSVVAGEPRILPVVKVLYKRRTMRLDVLLPSRLRHYWTIGSRVELGWMARIFGNEYHISDYLTPKTVPRLLRFSNTFIGPEVHWRVWKGLRINAAMGSVVGRSYLTVTGEDNVQDHSFNNGRFLSLGVYYGLP